MPFEPRQMKNEKEYLDISTSSESVVGQIGAERAKALLGNRSIERAVEPHET
jgi:hypothetical protein